MYLRIVLCAAAQPITVVVQAALLGRHAGVDALGAFGAVSISSGFFTRVFNFLVDGVSAKTGKSVGLHAWSELSSRVRMSLGFALFAGLAAASIFAVLKNPIAVSVLQLSPEVMQEANSYWWLRVFLVPLALLNMSQNGILQGFRQMHIVAGINTTQAILEMTGSAIVLTGMVNIGNCNRLLAMGICTMLTQLLQFVLGFFAMLLFPPPEAHGRFNLWKEWFGGSRDAVLESKEGETLSQRLMDTKEDDFKLGKERRDSDETPTHFQLTKSAVKEDMNSFHDSLSSLNDVMVVHGSGSSVDDTERCHDLEEIDEAAIDNAPLMEVSAGIANSPIQEDKESLLDFISDGLNMFVRSMILQLTFFTTLVAASRLGTPSLAAHSIVSQLWSLISYAVDGFAAAGIVLGSRLAAQAHDPMLAADARKHLQKIIFRVLSAGLLAGISACAIFAFAKSNIIGMFTVDSATIQVLNAGTWWILTVSQPVNGLVFVYDGLMYASQSFTFIRNYMLLGFFVIFCPILIGQALIGHSLAGVWAANFAINAWRVAGAAYLIHWIFMSEFDALSTCRGASASSLYDPEIAN